MDIYATSRFVRISPRKLVLVADSVRQLAPTDAVVHLTHMNKRGAQILKNTLDSAIANAKNTNATAQQELNIKSINVQSAGGMKRFHAVSRGMAHSYKKRMSHVTVVLTTGVDQSITKSNKNRDLKTK